MQNQVDSLKDEKDSLTADNDKLLTAESDLSKEVLALKEQLQTKQNELSKLKVHTC